MIVIPPIQITESMLVSSIGEPSAGEVVWSSTAAYSSPVRVCRVETHKIYESLSVTPTTDATLPELSVLTNTPLWSEISSTNRYAMFDATRNVKSSATNTITLEITPGQRIDALALLGLENVSNILVQAQYAAGTVTIVNKVNSYTQNGSTLYYSSYLKLDLAPYYNIKIIVVLTGTGIIKLGNCILGIYENIGHTQKTATVDALNFSTVTRDVYGNAQLVQRRSIPKISSTLMLTNTQVDKVARLRDYLNARPAVWSGLDQSTSDEYYESMLILGFYKTFTINIDNPIMVTVNLELEEI